MPIPLVPPWIRKVSPAASRPAATTFDQTVHATSGSPPAVTASTPSGSGRTWAAGTATFSAYPPPASSAHTSSPTDQPVTPSPSAAIRPAHSSPMISDAPGGGG